ncbi:MAG: hypothetical protein EOP00_23660 [Pedobacter sp.]|nr:MAG: hypothetical protein EOP00_23660 [Pedobacter sp.]
MNPFYILAIVVSLIIFVIIPILFIWIVFRFSKSRNPKISKILYSIALLIFGYFLITNFLPRESFYLDNFRENAGISLPESKVKIKALGNNSIFSFGDYSICYCYKFSSQDYANLYSKLLTTDFKKTEIYLETEENERLLDENKSIKIDKILTKNFGFKSFEILFLSDGKTIIFNSNKW